jgi:hypothetical protein
MCAVGKFPAALLQGNSTNAALLLAAFLVRKFIIGLVIRNVSLNIIGTIITRKAKNIFLYSIIYSK